MPSSRRAVLLAAISVTCVGLAAVAAGHSAQQSPSSAARPAWNPSSVIWRAQPASKWDDALPVGNGRLGAMVFGKTDEERIQINEDTYWTGGPYSTTTKGGAAHLPDIQKLIFDGELIRAHRAFGRYLMG